MQRNMWRIVKSHPFLLLGLLTYAMFLAVEALPDESHDSPLAQAAMPVARLIIIPMYLGWLLVTIVSVQILGADPSAAARRVIRSLHVAAGFAPYALADILLRWYRSLRSPAAA